MGVVGSGTPRYGLGLVMLLLLGHVQFEGHPDDWLHQFGRMPTDDPQTTPTASRCATPCSSGNYCDTDGLCSSCFTCFFQHLIEPEERCSDVCYEPCTPEEVPFYGSFCNTEVGAFESCWSCFDLGDGVDSPAGCLANCPFFHANSTGLGEGSACTASSQCAGSETGDAFCADYHFCTSCFSCLDSLTDPANGATCAEVCASTCNDEEPCAYSHTFECVDNFCVDIRTTSTLPPTTTIAALGTTPAGDCPANSPRSFFAPLNSCIRQSQGSIHLTCSQDGTTINLASFTDNNCSTLASATTQSIATCANAARPVACVGCASADTQSLTSACSTFETQTFFLTLHLHNASTKYDAYLAASLAREMGHVIEAALQLSATANASVLFDLSAPVATAGNLVSVPVTLRSHGFSSDVVENVSLTLEASIAATVSTTQAPTTIGQSYTLAPLPSASSSQRSSNRQRAGIIIGVSAAVIVVLVVLGVAYVMRPSRHPAVRFLVLTAIVVRLPACVRLPRLYLGAVAPYSTSPADRESQEPLNKRRSSLAPSAVSPNHALDIELDLDEIMGRSSSKNPVLRQVTIDTEESEA
ncbi:uncharacterized protein MONBRDRAFT_10535 [Monosiga brevicollis MX1]|uniref:TNFR-Cys domain-containing protein n=1 Tax=Monosiga brevicollis TaxID=81824 RepID=A9V6N2_MONBE|nr:uncharacterized protein MONBRDRAFT_10535 [Monosiga brevicollis MX1]EDQ86763.1 predicted protein [Monosiga brevicollis MX1]|eukprot:XP_001748308.1 hypothetical protein [Monosiga brevicollis MX1]